MTVQIPFGGGKVPLDVASSHPLHLLYPNRVPSAAGTGTIEAALSTPLASCSLEEFMRGSGEIWFIVNDATRPTPTAMMLSAIHARVGETAMRRVRFLVATGSHPAPTKENLKRIFGPFYRELKERIEVHDAGDPTSLTRLGGSNAGHEIAINRHIATAERVILLNSVEPHYFAGYTGGRKSIFPGVAGYRTIEQNHRLAMEKGATSLKLKGNPVHEEMMAAMELLGDKPLFSLQLVLDHRHRVVGAFSGHLEKTHARAVEKADEVFAVETTVRADIVVVVVLPPKDVNLYQAQNAVENGRRVLQPNGILILVSPCREGIGPPRFHQLLSACGDPSEVYERVRQEGYRLGYHKAVRFAETLAGAEVWAVTGIEAGVLRSMFLRPFGDLREAVGEACARKGSSASLAVLMDGDKTVPRNPPQSGGVSLSLDQE